MRFEMFIIPIFTKGILEKNSNRIGNRFSLPYLILAKQWHIQWPWTSKSVGFTMLFKLYYRWVLWNEIGTSLKIYKDLTVDGWNFRDNLIHSSIKSLKEIILQFFTLPGVLRFSLNLFLFLFCSFSFNLH